MVKKIIKKFGLRVRTLAIVSVLIFVSVIFLYFLFPKFFVSSYNFERKDEINNSILAEVKEPISSATSSTLDVVSTSTKKLTSAEKLALAEQAVVVTHIKTPSQVKAIYMTSWVGGNVSFRDSLVKIIDDTEINSVVIDIKDYTGFVSYNVSDDVLGGMGGKEIRIPDVRQFIDSLHKKGIYVIGRISSFQDPEVVKHHPELAVKRTSDGGIWKDRKGISWVDAGSKDMWDYLVRLGQASYNAGFDELNFDYIRFPSDGDMKNIAYPWSKNKIKAIVIRDFFSYLREKLGNSGAKLSADLFGMTTSNTDDLGIGQVLEYALQSMDYVAPMVYPSHYPAGFHNYKNPNAVPYEIIDFSMGRAVERAVATSSIFNLTGSLPILKTATSSTQMYTKESWDKNKLRPWLQDFSLGQPVYGATEVRAQIKAVYDVGLNSWMLWSASNKYTVGVLEK